MQQCRVGEALGSILNLVPNGRDKDCVYMSLCVCVCALCVLLYMCAPVCSSVHCLYVYMTLHQQSFQELEDLYMPTLFS